MSRLNENWPASFLTDSTLSLSHTNGSTVLCQINSAQLGEFGVYDLSLRPDGNGCTLETAKEPVNIYLRKEADV